MHTGVEELKRIIYEFENSIDYVQNILDRLTTNGAGLLYEIKQVVGADSDLGKTISNLGTSVCQARQNAVAAYRTVLETMTAKADQAGLYATDAQEAVERINVDIDQMDFS